MSLPNRIRQAREDAQMTQAELAQRLGKKDSSSVRNYEKGRNEPPISVLRQIAEITRRDVTWFLADEASRDETTRSSVSSYDPDDISMPAGLQRLLDLGCAIRPDELAALKGYADPTHPSRGARGAMAWSPGEWLDALLDDRHNIIK